MSTERIKLDDDEHVLLVVRKHWFILLSHTILFAFLALAPFVVVWMFIASDIADRLPVGDGALTLPSIFFGAVWFLIAWMILFSAWTDYYLDMWTVTTKRVIAVDQRGLFHRSVSSFRLERLQDLNVHVNGIIATALKFGTLVAETASGDDTFIIRGIPNPQEVKAKIQECADRLIFAGQRSATTPPNPEPHAPTASL